MLLTTEFPGAVCLTTASSSAQQQARQSVMFLAAEISGSVSLMIPGRTHAAQQLKAAMHLGLKPTGW